MFTRLKLFESYLAGASAPLYHSTTIFFASQILDSDVILGPVSLTRDARYVIDADEHPVTFILDRNKLSSDYKIVPFNYLQQIKRKDPRKLFNHTEAEEVIYKDIKNLHRYIIGIRFNDSIQTYRNMKDRKSTRLNSSHITISY